MEQDEIAYRSHMRAAAATEAGLLTAEIRPLDDIAHDTIVRPETSMEKLAKLPPVFDRGTEGTLTAGNSSPLTDGAAAVLLMSGPLPPRTDWSRLHSCGQSSSLRSTPTTVSSWPPESPFRGYSETQVSNWPTST